MEITCINENNPPKKCNNELDEWTYIELKEYFAEMADALEIVSATNAFLSNVEGLGDYFDEHPFYDFQAYLVLNVEWFERKKKILSRKTEDYRRFSANLQTFLSGKCDDWANGENIARMKSDCMKIAKYYGVETL